MRRNEHERLKHPIRVSLIRNFLVHSTKIPFFSSSCTPFAPGGWWGENSVALTIFHDRIEKYFTNTDTWPILKDSMDDGGDQGKRRPRTVRYKAINKNIFAFSLTRAVVKNHPKIHNPRGENERRAKKKIVAIKNLSNFAIKTYKDPHSLSHFVASGNFLFVKNSSWGRQAQKSTRNVSFIPVIFLRKSHDKFQKDKIISHKIYFMLYYEIV